MLVLSRKEGEKIVINDVITLTVLEVKGDSIRLGFDAPRNINIYRGEIYEEIVAENRQAAVVLQRNMLALPVVPLSNKGEPKHK